MIEIKNVSKLYSVSSKLKYQALNDFSLTINDGELLAIIGKSGAGKSTLLHIMGCIDGFDQGSVSVDGQDISKFSDKQKSDYRSSKVGIILQDFALIPDYSVYENVAVPLLFSMSQQKNKRAKINAALQKVGISDLKFKKANQLSGGQKQRVAIARAIVNNPGYVLADEPTGALDTETSRQIMDTLISLNKSGTTVIVITHDPDIAALCNRTVRIADGRIADDSIADSRITE